MCSLAYEQSNFEVKTLRYDRYEENILYSITASRMESEFLYIDKGMAVVIVVEENRCILATAKHLI